MNEEQRECEGDYQIVVTILKFLLKSGLVTEGEFKKARKAIGKRLPPVWGHYPEICPAKA